MNTSLTCSASPSVFVWLFSLSTLDTCPSLTSHLHHSCCRSLCFQYPPKSLSYFLSPSFLTLHSHSLSHLCSFAISCSSACHLPTFYKLRAVVQLIIFLWTSVEGRSWPRIRPPSSVPAGNYVTHLSPPPLRPSSLCFFLSVHLQTP